MNNSIEQPFNYTWLIPDAESRLINGLQWGNYAIKPIKEGQTVGVFGGCPVPRDILNTLELDRRRRAIQIDDDIYLVSSYAGEPGDNFNHSCEPSCFLMGAVILKAMRHINVGEELTYDYSTSDASDYDEFKCRCGKLSCRTNITGNDWQLPELQAKYLGKFSPYIALRIKTCQVQPSPFDLLA
jgi:hypothetical protein